MGPFFMAVDATLCLVFGLLTHRDIAAKPSQKGFTVSAIHLLSRLSRCRSSHNQNPPDLTEVLAAVSERQWVLERQWQSIIQSLPEASPAEITSRLLALDEERVRYRRKQTTAIPQRSMPATT